MPDGFGRGMEEGSLLWIGLALFTGCLAMRVPCARVAKLATGPAWRSKRMRSVSFGNGTSGRGLSTRWEVWPKLFSEETPRHKAMPHAGVPKATMCMTPLLAAFKDQHEA